MKNYLVTGGAGFIGSHFIEELLAAGKAKVINLDKLTYAGNPGNLGFAEGDPNYKFIEGDICDADLVFGLFEDNDFDVVINFAAESHVDRSIEDSAPFVMTNVLGVRVLLDAVKHFWDDSSGKKFIQVSTDEVYGSLKEGVFANEEFALNPGNPYSASKAAADLLVRSYVNTYSVPAIITRSCNNFGPRQFDEKFMPVMIRCMVLGKELPLYGDGNNKREWIYVKDHCHMLMDIADKGRAGEIYNIGSGLIKKNIDVLNDLMGVFGELTGKKIRESFVSYITDRKGHDFRYALDFSKGKDEFNWAATSNFHDNLNDTVAFYI